MMLMDYGFEQVIESGEEIGKYIWFKSIWVK